MAVNLTSGAISKILTGKCTSNDLLKPVLQVIHIDSLLKCSINGKQWYLVWLSDGSFWQYGSVISNKLQKGSIVQLTKFHVIKLYNTNGAILSNSGILGLDLTVIHSKCGIIGDPKRLPDNETPLVERTTPTIPDEDQKHANSHHVEEPPTLEQKPSTSTRKCYSHSPTQNKKPKLQSSDDIISGFGKDICETGINLTSGAITKIVTSKCTSKDLKPVLQVIIDSRLKRTISGKQLYLVALSDGSFWQYGVIPFEIFIANKLQQGSIVQLTKFQLTELSYGKGAITCKSAIWVWDYNLLRRKCDIIGDAKLYPRNETPLVVETTPTIPDEDHANSHHVEEPPTSKQKQDHADSLLNEDIDDSHHHVEEPPTSIQNPSTTTQKCSSPSPTQNKKQKCLSSNNAISVFGKDISETGINLTSGAITKIVTGNCTENDLKPVLQLIDFYSGSRRSKDDNQWYLVVLSDGSFWQFGHIADEIFISKNLQIGSIVQLTKFQLTKSCTTGEIRYIFVCDLNVICSKCDIIGDPTLIPHNETPKMEKSVLSISDHDRADPDLNEDVDDSHHVEEAAASKLKPSASTQMCSSHSLIQYKKQKRQSSDDNISAVAKDISKIARMMMEKEDKMMAVAKDVSKMMRMMTEKNNEDDDMGACFEKLENIGWGTEDPLYDTALLLFGESAAYRKLWLHLKPESCGKWVKNAGSKFGLLG